MDDYTLGRAVDAWLGELKAKGLSDQHLRQLASLLGEAMSNTGPTTTSQERTLRRFEAWQRTTLPQQPPATPPRDLLSAGRSTVDQ